MANTTNAPQVYGGDEVAAIVLDPGSFNTRIGYAGEDCPRFILPSHYSISSVDNDGDIVDNGVKVYGESINIPKSNHELKPIVEDGIIIDWDSAQEQFQYLFDNLKVNFDEQPMLFTESVFNTNENKLKAMELNLEYFKFPGYYSAKQPTLVSFACGRSNCLIVDVGHDTCSVTPVIDGICLIKNTMRTHYAGNYLNQQIQAKLKLDYNELNLTTKYQIKSKRPTTYNETPIFELKNQDLKTTDSFENYQLNKIFHEIKETVIQIPEKKLTPQSNKKQDEDLNKYSQEEFARQFELPTGQSITFGKSRFEIGDSLFDPENYQLSDSVKEFTAENGEPELKGYDYKPLKRSRKINEDTENTPDPSTPLPANDDTPSFRGLTQLVNHAISLIDVDIRSSIAHNIIVTGGTSLIPGLTERLNNELSVLNPGLKIRIHASGNTVERLNQSWIGGSILSSLGTFHQLWVSKQEYEEAGADRLLNQRFR